MYAVTAEPLSGDAVHDTRADRSRRTATTPVAASGTPAGTTALDGAEGTESPTAFVATTVKV